MAAVASTLSPYRTRAALAERESFVAFCHAYDLPAEAGAVPLYLTLHSDEGGPKVRARLARLDLAAHLFAEDPPSRHATIKQFLRGFHQGVPLGPKLERAEPLYEGHVRTLVDAILSPTWMQVRDTAFLLVMNSTGLRDAEVAALTWQDVHLRRDHAVVVATIRRHHPVPLIQPITLPAHTDPALCPVTALRTLRNAGAAADSPVFSQRGATETSKRFRHYSRQVAAPRQGRPSIGVVSQDDDSMRTLLSEVRRPYPIYMRDRAAVLLGFLGAMSNEEAASLRVGDIQVRERGLVLALPHRPIAEVGLPRGRHTQYCPIDAWLAWKSYLTAAGMGANADPAFVACDPSQPILRPTPIIAAAFTYIVARHCERAGLEGRYAYSSLRDGFIRTAIRAGVPLHVIGQHVGFRNLHGIETRQRREKLLRGNVAELLGL